MRWVGLLVAVMLLSVGCVKQEYGQCVPPKDNLKVLFKAKQKAHPFSHSFCLVCNTDIEPGEYGDWALEMGAAQGPSDASKVHPCLYVYTGSQDPDDAIDSIEMCESLVCDGGAEYSDMVGKNNGNFDVGPILKSDALGAEEWLMRDGVKLPVSKPAAIAPLEWREPSRLR